MKKSRCPNGGVTEIYRVRLYFSIFQEYQKPNVVYPDFDNFEVENKTDEWQTHFKFTLEEYKLEDFQDEVNKT